MSDTEYGIVTDNTALMSRKLESPTREPFKFFAGYEHIRMTNPSASVGYWRHGPGRLSPEGGVEDDNLDSAKRVQVLWAGVKYAYDSKTDITLSYYHELESDFRVPSTCSVAAGFRSSCEGTLKLEVSLYTDYHFTKRFDAYAGIAYSEVSGGLAIAIPHGPGDPYFHNNNTAPTLGVRFTF